MHQIGGFRHPRVRQKSFFAPWPRTEQIAERLSGAKGLTEKKGFIAALKRCATQITEFFGKLRNP